MGCVKARYVVRFYSVRYVKNIFLVLFLHCSYKYYLFVETENIGRAHIEFSQHLMDQIEKTVREFREEQKNKRKVVLNR